MADQFTERFKFLIEQTEGRASQFARATGKTPAQISDICNGRGKPTFDYLQALAARYAVSLDWLVGGKGDWRAAAADTEPAHFDTWDGRPVPEEAAGAFTLVPRYNVSASMGPGALIQSEQIVDYLAFKKEWIHSGLRADPLNLALISAEGDSMEPTVREGDLLLLDLAQTRVKKDSIYVLLVEDVLVAKRLQRLLDGNLVIRSDNPAYREQIVDGETVAEGGGEGLRVVGRVIWFGRQM